MPFYGVIIKAAHSGDSTGARQLKDPVLRIEQSLGGGWHNQ